MFLGGELRRIPRRQPSFATHFLVTVQVLTICGALAAAGMPPDFESRVDAIANAAIASKSAPGVSIAIACRREIVIARGYGTANLEHSVPVRPETVFHIASVSKNILAAVVLRLVDERKLRLDDEVTKSVPEAPVQGRRVTVRQLLNHTSGLYSFTDLPDAVANERLDLSHADVLSRVRDKPFSFEPGAKFRYDNTASYLAGMVVERVTGREYADVLADVLRPLGMASSRLCDARMLVPHLASAYDWGKDGFVPTLLFTWKLPWAGGAVCSTASDLVRWQLALDEGLVIRPESLALMRSPTVVADGTRVDYGLFTRLGDWEGHRVFGHTGGGGGFSSVLVELPDDQLTIVVLANREGAALGIGEKLARALLDLRAPAPLDLPVLASEAPALTGTFDSDEGKVELFVEGGRLHFRIPGTPGAGGVLPRQSESEFIVPGGSRLRLLKRDGRVEWAFVYTCGLMMDAKYRVP